MAPQARNRGLGRKAGLLDRRIASLADGALRHCAVLGCGRLPSARAGNGLSLLHCRYHVQANNRFGSYWKRNISAATLKPYRRVAERFVSDNAADRHVAGALRSLAGLLSTSGPVERVVDVNELLSPREKARAALARLRRAEIAPERLLIDYFAVAAAIADDPIKPGGEPNEYLRVQIAKRAFRKSSGYHAIYGPNARYDRYPRSGGLALRHLGAKLEEACAFAAYKHLPSIIALAAKERTRVAPAAA